MPETDVVLMSRASTGWPALLCSRQYRGRVVGGCEGAFEVDVDDGVPLALLHVDEHAIAQDPRVVDEHIEASIGVDRLADHPACGFEVAHVRTVRHRLTPLVANLGDDGISGAHVLPHAIACAAEIVDHDLGAVLGEHQRVFAPNAATRSGDNDNSIFAEGAHCISPLAPSKLRSRAMLASTRAKRQGDSNRVTRRRQRIRSAYRVRGRGTLNGLVQHSAVKFGINLLGLGLVGGAIPRRSSRIHEGGGIPRAERILRHASFWGER